MRKPSFMLQEELLCSRLGQLHLQWAAQLDTGAEGEWRAAAQGLTFVFFTHKEDNPKE